MLQDDPGLQPEDIRNLLKTSGPLVTIPDNGLSFPRSDVGSVLNVPEPSGMLMMLSGATLLAILGRKRFAS